MNRIDGVMPKLFNKLGLKKKYQENFICMYWEDIVGSQLATRTYPKGMDRRILLLNVANSSWAHHLLMIKKDIINKINNYFNENIVDDIRIIAGYYENEPNKDKVIDNTIYEKKYEEKKVYLNDEEKKWIYSNCDNIKNKKLRYVAMRLMKKVISRKKNNTLTINHCKKCLCICNKESEYCTICALEDKNIVKENIRKILKEAPWLSYDECNKYIICDFKLFEIAKEELLFYYAKEMINQSDNHLLKMSFTMLKAGLKPEQLTNNIIDEMVQKKGRPKYASTHRS